MKNLKNFKQYDKLIVTGPPRSGTTIAAMILAYELKYKFIDESFYDANNSYKFMWFLTLPRKMVIQMTAFLRDLYKIEEYLSNKNIGIVLVQRPIKDILASFKNSEKFSMACETSNGLFTKIDKEAQDLMFKHYGFTDNGKPIPQKIYDYFYMTVNNYLTINYKDLSNHKLFVKREDRRKHFKHIKQVKVDDPHYLSTKKGIMVLQ